MIELQNVTIHVGDFCLQDVSFRIETGQYAVLMGRTGRGKTTLLEAICGLRKIRSGDLFIGGKNVTNWSPADRQIGYVPQDLALFPTMTVQENLEFALRLRRRTQATIRARTSELAAVLGIQHLLHRRVEGLSGGESQRLALGRALSHKPSILLLDEPLSALDHDMRLEMHDLLRTVRAATGVTTLHVTHNPEECRALADCQLVLDEAGTVRQTS